MKARTSHPLTSLPNIGKTLAYKLSEVGIHTPEDLIDKGSEQAFIQIASIDSTACINMLLALEGAVQGVRWHDLAMERKEELKEFLKLKRI